MPKKKSSAFMIFVMEWKAKKENLMPLSDAVRKAGQVWATMSSKQRSPYIDRANKENMTVEKKEKLNCYGVPVSEVRRGQQQALQREINMKTHIEKILSSGCEAFALDEVNFYFITLNYFVLMPDQRIYIPAEVAVCEYSLRNGMNCLYSTLINPGVDVFGYAFEAQMHSNNTHRLPLPPKALGDTDCGGIYKSIIKFLRKRLRDGDRLPPVYTYVDHIPVVESCLQFLKSRLDSEDTLDGLRIYSIQYLFYALKRTTLQMINSETKITPYVTDSYFERDFFEYQSNIACNFHEEIDRGKYCSQSRVIRWSYMFSDYVCGDLAIEMLPGRHAPQNAKLNCIVMEPKPSQSLSEKSKTNTTNESYKSVNSSKNYLEEKPVVSSKAIAALSTIKTDIEDSSRSSQSEQDHYSLFDKNDFPILNELPKKPSTYDNSEPNLSILSMNSKFNWNLPREPKQSDFNMDVLDNNSINSISTINTNVGVGRGRGRGKKLNESLKCKF